MATKKQTVENNVENNVGITEGIEANVVAQEEVVAEAPVEEVTIPEEANVEQNVYVEQAVETPAQEISEAQIKALEEQGEFDYHIEGVNAVLKSPYTEGGLEDYHYKKGWNKAFDEDGK